MSTTTRRPTGSDQGVDELPAAWLGFEPGPWQDGIDVRDFIQRNYTPYAGDAGSWPGPRSAPPRCGAG